MGDVSTTLRLLRAHLEAAAVLVDALCPQPAAPPDELQEQALACPHCAEKREDKLEDSTAPNEAGRLVPRVTCLSCGKSFNPKGEEEANG